VTPRLTGRRRGFRLFRVRHLPRDPLAKIEHRAECIDRGRELAWHYVAHGLKDDVTGAAALVTDDQREALLSWLRWEEREARRGDPAGLSGFTARIFAECRGSLGEAITITKDTETWKLSKAWRERPNRNVIDFPEAVRRRSARADNATPPASQATGERA
jgi:hypothetical protein